jgi:hypothetical protein
MKTKKVKDYKINEMAEMTIETIIVIVLGLLVLVLILFLMLNPFIYDWVRNLPGYGYNDTDSFVNLSEDKLSNMGCTRIIARIGGLEGSWMDREQFFYIEGKKSDLYLNNMKIFLDISGSDVEIGMIGTDSKLIIYGPYREANSQEFLLYREKGLPKIEILNLLHESFKLSVGNYICKSDKDIEETRQCSQECVIFDGNCRKGSCAENEISYGQLNCESLQLCCVSKSAEKIEDNVMSIKVFGTREKDFIKETKVSPVSGKEGLQVINLDVKYNASFCYILRTNENVLKKSFDDVLKNDDDIRIMPVSWINSANENVIEFRAWDPKNKNKKVGKRLVIEGQKLPENYDYGEIIKDSDLKSKVENAGVGSVFYVLGLRFDWSKKGGNTYSYADYMIWKTKEGVVEIYVYGVYPAKIDEWHLLDCYGGIGSSIYIKNLKPSLVETLTESCGWS